MSLPNQNTPVLPGLEGFGTRTIDDLQTAGVMPIKPALDLPEVAYVAFEKLPAGKKPVVKKNAHALAFNPDLNQLSFVNLVTQYDGLDRTEGLNKVLDSVEARNAGEAGERVLMIVTKSDKFSQNMPKFDPKLIAKFNQGKATAGEILSALKWFGWKIERYRKGFNTMLELCDEEQAYHNEQGQKSLDACASDLVISSEEDERQINTNELAATLECLQAEIKDRLENEKLSDPDQTRLLSVSTLITARLKNLLGAVTSANQSSKRFAYQSNSNALTALNQLDFARYGIADWKANIVGELDAVQNVALNLAYFEALKFNEEQANRTADKFDEQMKSMAEMLSRSMFSVATIERMTVSLANAGKIMGESFEKARRDQQETAVLVEKSLSRVKASEDNLRKQVIEVEKKYGKK